eukprot:SAG11_NODE_36256_length_262_cov_1.269939_1_plen_72_part_00
MARTPMLLEHLHSKSLSRRAKILWDEQVSTKNGAEPSLISLYARLMRKEAIAGSEFPAFRGLSRLFIECGR